MRGGIRGFLRRAALMGLVLAALTAPAEARRFRVPIFTGGHAGSSGASGSEEVIDRVKDLPDTPAFEKDGAFLDVGFLYRRELSRGRVTGEHRAGGFYVLYHGDSYVKLDATMRSMLVSRLGYDPVSGHDRYTSKPAPLTAASKPRLSREERYAAARAAAQWSGDGSTSNIPDDPAATPRKTGAGGMLLLMFVLGAGLVIGVRWQVKRAAKALKPLFETRGDDPDRAAPDDITGFEARVAARLAEMQAGGEAPLAAPPPPAAVRTFGRRAA